MARILSIGRMPADAARPDNEVDSIHFFTRGPRHLEYHYYEAMVTPDIIHTVIEAELRGYDAVTIGCFYDLALHESREMTTNLVVTAPCEASVLAVASLCDRFSIIVGRRKWVPQMRANVSAYGFGERLASMPYIDLRVPEYHLDEAETADRFYKAGRKAIDEDGAEALILGCTASVGFFRDLQTALGVPVIDPAIAALKHAEHLIELRDRFGWATSRVGGYEHPPAFELDPWDLPHQYGFDDVTAFWNVPEGGTILAGN